MRRKIYAVICFDSIELNKGTDKNPRLCQLVPGNQWFPGAEIYHSFNKKTCLTRKKQLSNKYPDRHYRVVELIEQFIPVFKRKTKRPV